MSYSLWKLLWRFPQNDPHDWIGPAKIIPKWALICLNLFNALEVLLPCHLICTVTSSLDLEWKTTPKWVLICPNPTICSHVMERSSSMSADLYDLTIGLAMKNYPKTKWALIYLNLSISSPVMRTSSSMSADSYSDLSIGLCIKNYRKMSPDMPESIHWFPSYGRSSFMSADLYGWPHHWIGHEKLP